MNERAIFLAALDIDPAGRAAFLDQTCGGDAALRRGVEALLRFHGDARGFLDVPVPEQVAPAGTGTAEDVADLSFLAPPSEAGSLGWLDHYEILEVVGKGGMGVVLRARDTKLMRVVAIKALAAPLAASGTARRRFAREAQAAAAVRDDHVVAIHAVRDDAPVPYLVMEFIDGCNLETLLRRGGPPGVKEILRIGTQAAAGLAAAHRQGLIHRDVKPANILLENGVQRVKLTDFGLARAADDASLTQSGLIAGTPLYMAPEQAAGGPIDYRADLFSLGSVLYELCTGRPAFRAPTTLAVIRRVCSEPPRPIREVNPDVPEALCRVIDRLHAKSPAGRPASAGEVADLLAGLLAGLQGQDSRGYPTAAVAPSAPWPAASSRPWPWLVAAVAVLVCGLGITEATGVSDVGGTVVRLLSPEGTLVVEVDDPGVSVAVDGAEVVITGAGVREIRLKPGQYKVEASKDGKVVRQELVTVARNGRRVVRLSQESAPLPAAGEWERSVASLPADQQVAAVVAELRKRNPGFAEAVGHHVLDDKVHTVEITSDAVADLTPVAALRNLRVLTCRGVNGNGGLSDLRPLLGLGLTRLDVSRNQGLTDLEPLRGMPLEYLNLYGTRVTSGAVLKTMPALENLTLGEGTPLPLSELRGLKLRVLGYPSGRPVRPDLTALRGMPLRELNLSRWDLDDLSALKGLRLQTLRVLHCRLSDLTPLAGMPLAHLDVRYTRVRDLAPLEGCPLQTLYLSHTAAEDLGPLARTPLKSLELAYTGVADLRPLASTKLEALNLAHTKVTDLKPLVGLPLRNLGVAGLPAADLTPLKGSRLEQIWLDFDNMRDAWIGKGLPHLQRINGRPRGDFFAK